MTRVKTWSKELIWCGALLVAMTAWFGVSDDKVLAGSRDCYYDEYFNDCFFLRPYTCLCDI